MPRFSTALGLSLSALGVTLGTVLAASTPTIQDYPNSRVVTYLGQTPGWFICDSLDSPAVAELGWPDARGQSRLTVYSKASPGQYSYRNYQVGQADAGAGQVHYPLTSSGTQPGAGQPPFNVGAFNDIGMPGALTPPIVTLSTAETGGDGDCRWTVNTRLMGFDKKRSFMVSETPSGALTYQTWDYSSPIRKVFPDGVQRTSRPSVSVTGGTKLLSGNQETFVFQNAGYTYTVRVARQGQPAGASVTVSRGGRVVQTEPLTGYTYAVRK